MENLVFFIETPKNLTIEDFHNLRKLYLPIIGANSVLIYECLYDFSESKEKKLFEINDFCNKTQLNINIFEDSISKLQAVGLINAFKKNNVNTFIFELIKPFDVENFNKNPLLKSHLIKIIGQAEFDKFYFGQKQKFNNRKDFINVTQKYQDVFSNDFQENILKSDDYNTLDLNIDVFQTHEENIEKQSSSNFIKYLMKRNLSYYENQMINSLLKMGYSDPSINLLINFSFKHNNESIICPYIIKIAEDFRTRSILSFTDVKHEISIIETHKKKRKESSKNSNLENYKKINTLEEETNEFQSSSNKISINDLFDDEEIKGIF